MQESEVKLVQKNQNTIEEIRGLLFHIKYFIQNVYVIQPRFICNVLFAMYYVQQKVSFSQKTLIYKDYLMIKHKN